MMDEPGDNADLPEGTTAFEGGIAIPLDKPGGLGAALAALMLGGLGGRGDSDHPLLKRAKEQQRPPYRAARAEEFLAFIEGIQDKFKVGDIVELRADLTPTDNWPKLGDKCIVSQVLKEPYRGGKAGSWETAVPCDVALLFMENTDEEVEALFAETEGRPPKKPMMLEFLYDSRKLKKVGNVFDIEETKRRMQGRGTV